MLGQRHSKEKVRQLRRYNQAQDSPLGSLNPQFAEEISRQYPQVTVYSEGENLFYAAALNQGIGLSRGDFILCLNDDVVLDRRFIQQALRGFYQDGSYGLGWDC